MRAFLMSQSEGGGTRRTEIDREAVIGRSESCDVVLGGPVVSSRHARISWDASAGAFVLEDLKSRNGTYVGRSRVTEPVHLGPLEVITIGGEHELIFQVATGGPGTKIDRPPESETETADLGTSESPTEGEPEFERPKTTIQRRSSWGKVALRDISSLRKKPELPDEADAPTVRSSIETPDEEPKEPARESPSDVASFVLRLELEDGPASFVLHPGVHRIGRSTDCEIRIAHETLSRAHARLEVGPDGLMVEDLRSTNSTWVEGRRIEKPTLVRPGTDLRFGSVVATVEEAP